MNKQIVFFLATSSMIVYGFLFSFKYFGWPSAVERKNKMLRAVRTGFSSTALSVGLLLLHFYWKSPETFWTQWTISTTLGAIFFLAIPLFFIMTIASFVQFSNWERTESNLIKRLRKITDNKTKHDEGPR